MGGIECADLVVAYGLIRTVGSPAHNGVTEEIVERRAKFVDVGRRWPWAWLRSGNTHGHHASRRRIRRR